VSRVITCPHCQKKLSVKDDFQGRRLACPQCKGTFDAPSDGSAGAAAGPEADFFAGLGAGDAGGGKKSASGKAAVAARTPAGPSRSKTKAGKPNPLLGVYIAGGVGAVVIIAVLASMMSSGPSPKPTKWGLTEGQRLHVFQDAIRAVDEFGMGESCKKDWKQLEEKAKITDEALKAILEEGFKAGWEQPEWGNYDATKKSHRMEWTKRRNELRREPLM
jgi:hypothetical protein